MSVYVYVCERERKIFVSESVSNIVSNNKWKFIRYLPVRCSFRISHSFVHYSLLELEFSIRFVFVIPPSFIRSISASPSIIYYSEWKFVSPLSMRELLFLFPAHCV